VPEICPSIYDEVQRNSLGRRGLSRYSELIPAETSPRVEAEVGCAVTRIYRLKMARNRLSPSLKWHGPRPSVFGNERAKCPLANERDAGAMQAAPR